MRDGPTWRRRGRGVSAGVVRSAWPLLWRPRLRGVDIASRRILKDPVKARRHPLGVVAVVIAVSAVVLTGGFFLRHPLCLDLARRASNAWRSRFFFFFSFFSESLADFCLSADWCRLSRSTPSSFTGGLEVRTSISPSQVKAKLKKRSRETQNQNHVQEENLPDRLTPRQAS